jgi:hypothetical protein
VDLAHEVGITQVQLVVATIDVDAFGIEHCAHCAVYDVDTIGLEEFAERLHTGNEKSPVLNNGTSKVV